MRGHKFFAWALLAAATAGAEVAVDFGGDGRSNPAVYVPTGGLWRVAENNGGVTTYQWGWRESRPVPADYDGDGQTDIAVFDRTTSNWYIRNSSTAAFVLKQFGFDQGRPVPGDYDGDGKADLAVYVWQHGLWVIQYSASSTVIWKNFGWPDARPVQADYDGDGRTDLAVWNRFNSTWYIDRSSAGLLIMQYGWRECRPVVADYDGDGKDDISVYHPASGTWYILQSSNVTTRIVNWGWREAQPEPGDYDGDGKADIAVQRRRTGEWFIQQSSNGLLRALTLGGPDACPLPAYRDGAIANQMILAFGDSITYGMGSQKNDPRTGYPILLERVLEPLLGGHCITLNEGKPGEQTTNGKNRIKTVLQSYNPDLSLIMQGVNDTFYSVPNSTISGNLKSMINSCKNDGSSALVSTLTPVIKSAYRDRSAQEKRIESFNPNVPGIASSTGIAWVDNWSAITSKPNWESDLIEQKTANHPNDAGYAVMRETWLAALLAGHLSGLYY